MYNPLVSIILVNYNGFEDTLDCVKSLEKIDYDNFNIIVVDNCSTVIPNMETLSIIQQKTIYIQQKENLGFSVGNNVGIKYAIESGSDYILLLNNDTIVSNDFLNTLISEAQKHDNNVLVTGKIYYHSNPREIWYGGGWYDYKKGIGCHERNHEIDVDCHSISTRYITFATGCLMLIPVKVIEKIGLLDETFFLYAEDTEYSLRALEHGIKIVFCENACIFHKVSRSTKKMSTPALYYLIRNSIRVSNIYSKHGIRSKFYWALYCIKRTIKKDLSLRIALKAYISGLRNEKGPINLI